MTLAEIKVESLRLMALNDEILRAENISTYETDENYKDFLSRMDGAISRALSRFMTLKILPNKSVTIVVSQGITTNNFLKLDLGSLISDYGAIEGIIRLGSEYENIDYQRLGGTVIAIPYASSRNYKGMVSTLPTNPQVNDCYFINNESKYYNGSEWVVEEQPTFEVVYQPIVSIPTTNDGNIDVPTTLARAIPYFVKGDLYELEEPKLAIESRNIFENIILEYMSYGTDRHTHQEYVKNEMF